MLAFAILVTAVSSLWRNNVLLALFMLVEGAMALAFWHDVRDISGLVVIGGMGAVAEAVFVGSGAWHDANPSVFGVPLWFPIAFGTTGLIGRRLSCTMASLWDAVVHGQAASVAPDPRGKPRLDGGQARVSLRCRRAATPSPGSFLSCWPANAQQRSR